uniref:Uncharacterized protein n=1 Tax=Rhizophora mucronata TaxID=61149 RepID=A0A2P2QF90_RHIMU
MVNITTRIQWHRQTNIMIRIIRNVVTSMTTATAAPEAFPIWL